MENKYTWEEPTNDLRQMKCAEWVGDHLIVYFKVQRAYKVQAGPVYMAMAPYDKVNDQKVTDPKICVNHLVPNWMKIETVWRDLPIVMGPGCEEVFKTDISKE